MSYALIYSRPPLLSSGLSLSRLSSGQKASETGQKLDFLWCALVFSRDFRRPNRAKIKIYLIFEGCRASGAALSLGRWWCPLVAGGRGCSCYFANISKIGQNPLLLVAFLLCVWWDACKYAFISQFRGVLTGFVVLVWVCIALMLCVDCGAFVFVSGLAV